MYKLTNTTSIIRIEDNASIPADKDNTDYQVYLAWVKAGNTPAPYVEPIKPIPTIVSMRQARLALLQFGLLANVNSSIAAGSEAGKITWEFASDVSRSDPLVDNLSTSLGLSSADLDKLFILANNL